MEQQAAKRPSLIESLIFLYCAWSSRALLTAWQEAPLERYSWVLFLIWLIPLILQGVYPQKRKQQETILGLVALILALIGNIGSLNALCYLALALASGAMLSFSVPTLIWQLSSMAWMPALGWISAHYVSIPAFPLRLLIVLLGVGSWGCERWRVYQSEMRSKGV